MRFSIKHIIIAISAFVALIVASYPLLIGNAWSCQDEGAQIALNDFGRIYALTFSIGVGGSPSLQLGYKPGNIRIAMLNPSIRDEIRWNTNLKVWELLRSVQVAPGRFSDPKALNLSAAQHPLEIHAENGQSGGQRVCAYVNPSTNTVEVITTEGLAGFADCTRASIKDASHAIRVAVVEGNSQEFKKIQVSTETVKNGRASIDGSIVLIAPIGGRMPSSDLAKFEAISLSNANYEKIGCRAPRKVGAPAAQESQPRIDIHPAN